MSGTKRLAKRSIIGTRVSALWQDGRYYPGVIRSLAAEATPVTDDLYTVHFDDGFESNLTAKDIIGQGFQTGPSGRLKHNQKIFVTVNGREVTGTVAHHDRLTDEVIILAKQTNGEENTIHRKVDEIRLLESRKSARLLDSTRNYSKLADLQVGDSKKRAVSRSIDVPNQAFKQRQRLNSSGEVSENGENSRDDEDNERMDDEDERMDEGVAALVLTSLSVSPQSPPFNKENRASYDQVCESLREHSYVSSSITSSGFCSGQSEREDPSPPHHLLSESAPASFGFAGNVKLSPLGETGLRNVHNNNQVGTGVKYRCTWRGCSSVFETTNSIERHIRRKHLDQDSDIELSDNEEEFYYEEIDNDELLDSVTESFAGMLTSCSLAAPLTHSFDAPCTFDHDYLKKEDNVSPRHSHSSSLPSGGADFGDPVTFTSKSTSTSTLTSLPISIPEGQIKRSLSWQIQSQPSGTVVSPPHRSSKPTPQERLQQHQAQSPKSHMLSMSPLRSTGPHRKARSDVRKCRKVYGMDNRDQWCTQCKWKKACTRFVD